MTSIAAWPGIDSRGLSTLYIVADSRISWKGSPDRWELGAKVFASPSSPDIFGFYGDMLIPAMVLPRFVDGPLLSSIANAQDRHDTLVRVLHQSADSLPNARRGTFGVLHGSRAGAGMESTRHLWHVQWTAKEGWADTPVLLEGASALTIALGSGELPVFNHTTAARTELGVVSRSVFTGFCDALISGEDPYSWRRSPARRPLSPRHWNAFRHDSPRKELLSWPGGRTILLA